MRQVPETMASALDAGAAKLCYVWRLTRADGAVLGFTDHDRDLNFMGVVCRAQTGLTQGAASGDLGMDSPDNLAVSGLISGAALAAADIEAGLYDAAELRVFVVDWTDPSQYVELDGGYLARLEVADGIDDAEGAFVAHVEGVAARLERSIGRCFGFLCDAALGDARCGLSLGALGGATCDKRYATCRDTFHNIVNFRGFPDLPGEDFLTVYPRDGQVLDGGSTGTGAGR
jgi:hypothetical protein